MSELAASSGLDMAYLADAADAIAGQCVRRGRACELSYTPGNGTLYELVLSPFGNLALSSAQDYMDHEKRRSIFKDRPELLHDEEAWLLLSWIGHGAWPVDLRHVWHDSYIAEKYADCTLGDASAIRQLLLAVAQRAGFRSMAVVR